MGANLSRLRKALIFDSSRNDDEEQLGPMFANKDTKMNLKFAILGTGMSGKSTFFKQCRLLFGNHEEFNESLFYDMYGNQYLENTYSKMYAMLASKNTVFPLENFANQDLVDGYMEYCEHNEFVVFLTDRLFTLEKTNLIEYLWRSEPLLHKIWHFRHKINISPPPALPQMLESVSDVFVNKQLTKKQALQTYRKTTGIINSELSVKNHTIELTDTGGQRSERVKWMHVMSESNAFLFLVNLSDYTERCYEDDVTNRMQESLSCFANIANRPLFDTIPLYLIFTHSDEFKRKIYQFDLSSAFEDAPVEMKIDSGSEDAMQRLERKIEEKLLRPDYFAKTKTLNPNSYLNDLYNALGPLHISLTNEDFARYRETYPRPSSTQHSSSSSLISSNFEYHHSHHRQQHPLYILHLPSDLLIYLCEFLSDSELCTLQLLCNYMYNIVNTDYIWRQKCFRSKQNLSLTKTHEKLIQKAYHMYRTSLKEKQERKFFKCKWKFTYASGGVGYFGAMKFVVKKYLEKIANENRRRQIKQNVFICSCMDSRQVQEIMEIIVSDMQQHQNASVHRPIVDPLSSTIIDSNLEFFKGKRLLTATTMGDFQQDASLYDIDTDSFTSSIQSPAYSDASVLNIHTPNTASSSLHSPFLASPENSAVFSKVQSLHRLLLNRLHHQEEEEKSVESNSEHLQQSHEEVEPMNDNILSKEKLHAHTLAQQSELSEVLPSQLEGQASVSFSQEKTIPETQPTVNVQNENLQEIVIEIPTQTTSEVDINSVEPHTAVQQESSDNKEIEESLSKEPIILHVSSIETIHTDSSMEDVTAHENSTSTSIVESEDVQHTIQGKQMEEEKSFVDNQAKSTKQSRRTRIIRLQSLNKKRKESSSSFSTLQHSNSNSSVEDFIQTTSSTHSEMENSNIELLHRSVSSLIPEIKFGNVIEEKDVDIQLDTTAKSIPYNLLETLTGPKHFPKQVDSSKREEYLSEEEFMQVFHLSKHDFAQLPSWKKMQLKKAVGLF